MCFFGHYFNFIYILNIQDIIIIVFNMHLDFPHPYNIFCYIYNAYMIFYIDYDKWTIIHIY